MRIDVKPIETIIFALEDKEIKCRLTVRAFSLLQEEELGNIQELFKNVKTKPYESIAKLIYIGCKPYDEDFTMTMAEIIAESMSTDQLIQFANKAEENVVAATKANGSNGKKPKAKPSTKK